METNFEIGEDFLEFWSANFGLPFILADGSGFLFPVCGDYVAGLYECKTLDEAKGYLR